MQHTVNPRLYSCCRPYVLNSQLATLCCWNPAVRRSSRAHHSDIPSPSRSVSTAVAADPLQHGSLTVDTFDRDGNIAIPVDLLHILPKLTKFLRGDFELGIPPQALEEQVAVHRTAVEQARQWLESLDDSGGVGKREFLEEFQQQHTHACSDGSLKARWLSINTDTAQVGTRIRQDSPDFDAPFSSQIASSPAQNSHTTPAENGVHGQQAANRSENPPHLQKQSSTFPVPLGPLGAPINDFSRAAKPRNAGLVCHTGLSPMHAGMSLEDAGVPFEVSVPSLNFSARNCDIAQGPWRSFLVLLSEDASFFESENLWPNFLCHRGRTLHNITCTHAVRFLADPCVSEINKHVRNMARHGEDNRLEYLVQRWGKDTLIELCQIHDKLGLKPSTAATCAHAHGRQQEDIFG